MEDFEQLYVSKNIVRFLLKTIDGIYTLILSCGYLGWALSFASGILDISSSENPYFVIGLFFMPFLFIVVYIRHRIGSLISDNNPVVFCIASNTALALAPLYIYYWK